MKKPALFFLAISVCFTSCYPEKTYYEIFTKSYVLFYRDVDYFDFISNESGLIAMFFVAGSGGLYSKSKNYTECFVLCEKHNDLTYNRKVRVDVVHSQNSFMALDFKSIELKSDKDFDGNHPAGASLADLALFFSMSPYPYIRSGYTSEFDWMNYDEVEFYKNRFNIMSSQDMATLHPVKGLAGELGPDDLIILGTGEVRGTAHTNFGYITFVKDPQTEKQHNITVTLTDDRGRVYESTVPVNFK